MKNMKDKNNSYKYEGEVERLEERKRKFESIRSDFSLICKLVKATDLEKCSKKNRRFVNAFIETLRDNERSVVCGVKKGRIELRRIIKENDYIEAEYFIKIKTGCEHGKFKEFSISSKDKTGLENLEKRRIGLFLDVKI